MWCPEAGVEPAAGVRVTRVSARQSATQQVLPCYRLSDEHRASYTSANKQKAPNHSAPFALELRTRLVRLSTRWTRGESNPGPKTLGIRVFVALPLFDLFSKTPAAGPFRSYRLLGFHRVHPSSMLAPIRLIVGLVRRRRGGVQRGFRGRSQAAAAKAGTMLSFAFGFTARICVVRCINGYNSVSLAIPVETFRAR